MVSETGNILTQDFEAACLKTVDKWDLETLVEYAAERMAERFRAGDWVVIGPDGAFEEGFRRSAVADRAKQLAIASAESLSEDRRELYRACIVGNPES